MTVAALKTWPRDVVLVASMALAELRHRRSLLVVSVLTVGFLVLYGWGVFEILPSVTDRVGANIREEDTKRGVGFILLGIAVFATFSLASVLAVFTTMSTVKGEAELGLLQSMLVRPIARSAVVTGRVVAATFAGFVYCAVVISGASLLTSAAGGTPPGNLPAVILALTAALAVVAGFGVLLSTVFGTAATGMATTMLISIGFFSSLVRQIGESTDSPTVAARADLVSHVLGFNVLYEGALGSLTAGVAGLAGLVIQLGPFGTQREFGSDLVLLTVAELVLLVSAATWRLRRLDL
ncbi:MAG: ABC transporter permease [Solirubrobacteraceae bacterium]|nr:ABC transporter permease [Solirubrobacteraceae bacterium]